MVFIVNLYVIYQKMLNYEYYIYHNFLLKIIILFYFHKKSNKMLNLNKSTVIK